MTKTTHERTAHTDCVLTRRAFCAAALGCGSAVLLGGCVQEGPEQPAATAGAKDQEQRQSTFFCFDTVCVIGGAMADETLATAVARCQEFEALFSRTIETSDVARINAAGGEAVEVAPETAELIAEALRYSEESEGLFDVTIGAVTRLWDFHEAVVPDEEALAEALAHVGWQQVRVDPAAHTVALGDAGAALDLGGIAKGYVADIVCDELKAAGVPSGYVNLGGNVAVFGGKPDGSAWGIGVRDPADETGEKSCAIVHATDGSVVTSGLYERQFEKDGKRYWHILDPRTGWPVESDIVSASIFSERSIDGDGYTKPLFMLGRDAARTFLEEHGVDGILITADGEALLTSGSAFELL